MDEKEDKAEVPPPNPSQDFGVSAQSNEGNKSVDKGERDYTRQVYQNLMAVMELLEVKSPLAISQRQIQRDLNISKGVAHDICWNLCARGWVEDMGGGMVRTKCKTTHLEAAIGKKVVRVIEEVCGVVLGGSSAQPLLKTNEL